MNRTRLKLLAGICLAGCMVFLWMNWRIGSTVSPEERHYREMEWRLSQEADEVLSRGGARPWESDFRARLDLAVIEHDTKMHESSTYELKAMALMEDRAGRADLFFYVAVGFTLIWFPGFLFLWLTGKKESRPAPDHTPAAAAVIKRPRQIVDMATLTSRDTED